MSKPLAVFDHVSIYEVKLVTGSLTNKSDLDHMPTSTRLTEECLFELAPHITGIVNSSLEHNEGKTEMMVISTNSQLNKDVLFLAIQVGDSTIKPVMNTKNLAVPKQNLHGKLSEANFQSLFLPFAKYSTTAQLHG